MNMFSVFHINNFPKCYYYIQAALTSQTKLFEYRIEVMYPFYPPRPTTNQGPPKQLLNSEALLFVNNASCRSQQTPEGVVSGRDWK